MLETILLIAVILLSLFFIYTTGFQDGSSVSASAIGCRALSPAQAVLVASIFEFAGAMLGGSTVANSVTAITSCPGEFNLLPAITSGLLAAIGWNFITRSLKLPSSSTHALFGGILGAVYAASGNTKYIVWGEPNSIIHSTGVWKVALSLFLSPLIGIMIGYLMLTTMNLLLARSTTRINRTIKLVQWVTLALLAYGHGVNDSQKAMGVIVLSLQASGLGDGFTIPFWVRLATGLAITAGVASLTPGIVRKVGSEIYKLRPLHGLTAQLASATIILTASLAGGPVSTSQVVSSTVIGVGSADRLKGVRWLAAREMLIAWFLTIPATALLSGLIYLLGLHLLA
ncbi:MAG: inorganic phosphate transporter [Candidatus Melainabacteria bacterium]|nr:inorganic phosphate transporter [Candidatus Melainabacteria bacterium]